MESTKNGHVLEFKEDTHRYKLDGRAVPGTTTFTKGGYPTSPLLTSWMVGQGAQYAIGQYQKLQRDAVIITDEKIKEIVKASKTAYQVAATEAADIGTVVHDYAHLVETGRAREALQMLSEYEGSDRWDRINNGVKKFDEWRAQTVDEIVALEEIVASVEHQFGGKFDRLTRRAGRIILSDYKTSNGIYVDQFIQLAAYSIAIEEWLGLRVEGYEILRFGKEDGEFQTLMIDNNIEMRSLRDQAIRCRDTYTFKKFEADRRFKFGGKSA